MHTFPRSEAKKKCMAHALYDNLAETTDELAFRRGDTLMVLEQNTGGLDGWWLCSLRGRQGIVPGNRLRLMPGVYDPAQAAKMTAQLRASTGRVRRSWSPNAKASALNQNTSTLPRGRSDRMIRQYSAETYDTPPPPVTVGGAPPQEDYDTPRPLRIPPTPPPTSAKPTRSSAPALTSSGGPAVHSSSALTSGGGPGIYSAPRADAPPVPNRCSGLSTTSTGSSVRSSSGSSSNRSSLDHAPEPVALRRPPGIPENGLYGASEEEYDVPRSIGVASAWQTAAADEGETYDVPPTRLSASSDFTQPLGMMGRDTYDFPPPRGGLEGGRETYDFPQPRAHPESRETCDFPPPRGGLEGGRETHDFPQPRAHPESRETYDFPPTHVSEEPRDTYDFPRPSAHEESTDTYDSPPPPRASEMQSRLRIDSGGTYDVPVPLSRLAELEIQDSPRSRGEAEADSSNETLESLDTYDYPCSAQDLYDSPRAAKESYPATRPGLDIYDSPRAPLDASPRRIAAPAHGSRDSLQSTAASQRTSTLSDASAGSDGDVILRGDRTRVGDTVSRNATYWMRSAGSGSGASLSSFGEPRELPLDTDAGLETVSRLEQELNATVARLFAFVVPGWRGAAHMEACAVDLKLTVVRMRTALRELVQFAYGAVVATARGPEHRLGAQFVQVLRPLEETMRLIESAAETQERAGWAAATLTRVQGAPADALDQLLACAQSLSGDVRQLVAFVRGNAPLIFRRRASVVPERGSSPPGGPRVGLMGDYDYVCLQTSGSLVEEGEEVRSRLPEELRGSFDNLMKESQVPVSNRVDANDQQVLEFYRGQTEAHHEFLNNAIDALFQTIQNNQPPKVFVAHSKFVILSAHKLVYIGDTVHRTVMHPGVRRDALAAADALFATLKRTVQSTKTAALQFPSAHAVQEMADAVLDVSSKAGDLKHVMDEVAL